MSHAVIGFLLWNDLRNGAISAGHHFSIEPYNHSCNTQKNVSIIWLGVGPDRVNELKMHQRWKQYAAARCVEQWRHDHADGDRADDERRKRPGALLRPAQQERRQMPESPYGAKNQRSPDGRKLSLEQRQGESPPAKLLDGPFDRSKKQGDQKRLNGGKRKWFIEEIALPC